MQIHSPLIKWEESGQRYEAVWRSPTQAMPTNIVVADDTLSADKAYKLVKSGTGLLWRGDFHNARQLVLALARRLDRKPRGRTPKTGVIPPVHNNTVASTRAAFSQHRETQERRAVMLGRVLLQFETDHSLKLRRAPDARTAITQAWGAPDGNLSVASIKDLQGMIGAHEWQKKGVNIPFLGASIHPHYGVYSPLRGVYIALIATTALSPEATTLAFDIGTGTGVIAAVLAKRGIQKIVATDIEPRAIKCAQDNLARLGFGQQIEVVAANLFPPGRAALIVCNPPWLPTPASATIERAVYDPDSAMLRAFLSGLSSHLTPGGEGWLVLSDLAEHLGLRSREELMAWVAESGLQVLDRHDAHPTHPKSADPSDPLFVARSKEVTSLWRLSPV